MMKIWMTRDPETYRVALLDHEPGEGNFPLRAGDWEIRVGEVDPEVWDDLMAARVPVHLQTALHRQLWEEGTHP